MSHRVAQRGGNTKPRAKKRVRARAWCFTWNNYTEQDIEKTLAYFGGDLKCSYAFQEEEGDEKKTPHLQGVVRFGNAKDFSALKAKFPKVHWEICKDWDAAIEYCLDPRKRKPGGRFWESGCVVQCKDPLEGKTLRAFQREVCNIVLREPHDRRIYWFVDEKGAAGKSSLIKHIKIKNKKQTLLAEGKGADVLYALKIHLDTHKIIKNVFIDIPRCMDEKYISYSTIEKIKNGYCMSGKYESCELLFDPPHIFVFANKKPDISKLSQDRWLIYEIDEEGDFQDITQDCLFPPYQV